MLSSVFCEPEKAFGLKPKDPIGFDSVDPEVAPAPNPFEPNAPWKTGAFAPSSYLAAVIMPPNKLPDPEPPNEAPRGKVMAGLLLKTGVAGGAVVAAGFTIVASPGSDVGLGTPKRLLPSDDEGAPKRDAPPDDEGAPKRDAPPKDGVTPKGLLTSD